MGGSNPEGERIDVTSLYFERNEGRLLQRV